MTGLNQACAPRLVTLQAKDSGIPCRNDGASVEQGRVGLQRFLGRVGVRGANSLAMLCTTGLLAWPGLAGADDIDALLQRNMRVYAHAPPAASPQGQRLAPGSPGINQAEMVVYDNRGRTRSRQRVALGPMPPPPSPGDKPLTEYPRKPGPPKPKYEIDYTFSAGYREDRLNWNIAAQSGHPNVSNELKWENINIAQIEGKAEITSPGGWHFQGGVGYGFVTAGKNQESKYFRDNLADEYSRSYSSTNSDYTLDASLAAGYRFALRDNDRVWLGVTPLVGYSYHEQNLTDSNGVQAIATPNVTPDPGPFPASEKVNRHYDTQWHGPWLGLKATALPWEWMEIFGQFEYHWVNYYAKANLDLDGDYQHPLSFKHNANGDGFMTNAGLRFRLTPAWALELAANYVTLSTDSGGHTYYGSNGNVGVSRLNRVGWDSWGANAGLRYRY